MADIKQIDKKTDDQMQKINYYASHPFGFMVIAGTNGTGKSYVAEAIYNLHTPYRLPARDSELAYFITQADLNENWSEVMGETKNLSQTFKNTKLFVLDDLGTRIPSPAFLDFLYAILDHRWRYREKLGTIITTNMNSEIMRKSFGDAIVSRIASGICMRFEGPDRRFNEF